MIKRQVLKSLQAIVGGQSQLDQRYNSSGLVWFWGVVCFFFLGGGWVFGFFLNGKVSQHLAKEKRGILFLPFRFDTGTMDTRVQL